MGAVIALDTLFNGGRVWKGRPAAPPASVHPTGLAALDAVLPTGGWPEAALSEILMAKEGVGELQLVLPTLARLSTAGSALCWWRRLIRHTRMRGRTPGWICACSR